MAGYGDDGRAATQGDEWFRPAWDSDEEDAGSDSRALVDLLGPALAASDALARLDARTNATSEPVREGLLRRLALHEAAGWLATQSAWVHPLDLALRAGGLAGPFGLAAAVERARTAMPNTMAADTGAGWQARADAGRVSGEEPLRAVQETSA